MHYINYSTQVILPATDFHEHQKNVLLVNPQSLVRYTEQICNDDNCKYPQLTLRILNHVFAEMDTRNRWNVSARQLSKRFDVHYDTITKALKYLRSINVINSNGHERATIH